MIEVAGQHFKDEDELYSEVYDQMAGGWLWIEKNDIDPRQGVQYAMLSVQGTPIGEKMVDIITDMLLDSNIEVRSRAFDILNMESAIFNKDRLVEIFHLHSDLIVGQSSPLEASTSGLDFETILLRGIARHLTKEDTEMLDVLKERTEDSRIGKYMIGCVIDIDLDWVLNRDIGFVKRYPPVAFWILDAISDQNTRLQLLQKYKSVSEEVRLSLLKQFLEGYRSLTKEAKPMRAILEEPNP